MINTMTLREALEVLGPDRVRKGMRAIDDRREGRICATCFVGEAFGGTVRDYYRAHYYFGTRIGDAVRVCERYFEGITLGMYAKPKAILRAECIVYLAEHGTAVEPAVLETATNKTVLT